MQRAITKVVGLRALRRDVQEDIHIAVLQPANLHAKVSRRFAFARAIGDAICYPDEGSAPITQQATKGYRQAASGAFAAEFLAPAEVVEQLMDDGKDVDDIASELNVSSYLVGYQLENRERIRYALAA